MIWRLLIGERMAFSSRILFSFDLIYSGPGFLEICPSPDNATNRRKWGQFMTTLVKACGRLGLRFASGSLATSLKQNLPRLLTAGLEFPRHEKTRRLLPLGFRFRPASRTSSMRISPVGLQRGQSASA